MPRSKTTHVVFAPNKKGKYSARIESVRVVLDEHSFDIVTNGDSYFIGGLSSFDEVENMVRDVFNNQWKYQDRDDQCAEPWPELAAQAFGEQPWTFHPPLAKSNTK